MKKLRAIVGVVGIGFLGISPCQLAGATPEGRVALSSDSLRTIRPIAIQHSGRHKPFDSFAWETLKFIAGSPRRGSEDPVETILSIIAFPEDWIDEKLISVPFVPLREVLGLERKTSHVSFNDLIATRKLMRLLPPIVAKQQRDEKLTMLEQETMDVYERFATLNTLFEHQLYLVPPPSGTNASWLPILVATDYPPEKEAEFQSGWMELIADLREGESEAIDASARRLVEALQNANPSAYPARWRLILEVCYNKLGPFRIARLFYMIAFLGFAISLSGSRRLAGAVGISGLWAAFLLHGSGIIMRVILGGRPPVSNFYETMLWLPFVAAVLALIFEGIYHARYFGLSAAGLAAVTLLLADYVPLDSSIAPVVAVLRSTLWLTVHVLIIVASYGALALATVLAHVYGWLYLVRRSDRAALEKLGLFLYRAIQVGVVLLAGGVMLGAVWANASWGRYWGWDPKETWALITLLWFLAILHGRFAGWIKGVGVALLTISGFFLLLMTYYGVSFYLVGLHSYAGGHAKPLPPLLIAYLLAELLFIAAVGVPAFSRRRLLPPV